MRSLIIIKSIHHENTHRVAKVMARELNADLIAPEECDTTNLDQYDLLGFVLFHFQIVEKLNYENDNSNL